MTNYVMLNNVEHFDIKVMDQVFTAVADNKTAVLTFPTEFSNIQREYPILLSKDPASGQYQAVALLGIQKDENLFLQKNPAADNFFWSGGYVPAILAKGPFITGLREQMDGSAEAMVYIDLNSPKLNNQQGKALFLPQGGNSPYLDYVTKLLNIIQQGKIVGDAMFAQFAALELIEPLTINIDLVNGDKHQLRGYYTISEEKLMNLTGDKLELLNKSGYLQGAYLMLASLTNIEKLIRMKNARM
ncbi:SapC family protein [Cellvibrio sp. OA-2007]|uniref:SapC family protein n=1 Tax=Cellvibrio sp. OA-2007 TaxID=529823 RepID=UPI0007824A8C|nr:SapC family protein [Cellvibrio sp. OA-2007]